MVKSTDLGLIPNTHMASHNHLLQGDPCPLLARMSIHVVHRHKADKNPDIKKS